ncbi:MAG TPA: phosphoribosylformylglycinamidine synthase subunit PurL [Rubrobacteraceae bacterium]|nr:phosphoribosylformylglycinamidine synthase subunit PurL [Rubrobacteraceae bacterium]
MNIQETYTSLGLSDFEYDRILELMGRAPNYLELSLFSVMWSEHCGYKNSRPLLGRFPNKGPRVLQGPGENAGVVEVGDGWALVFKMESHNHPSAVEPFEGAATGVGGIIRDVLAMGARPVALLNSLRFGPLDDERNRYLFREVVRGIGHYGNAVGVPTVGGEVEFAEAYSGNPLVNAMCVGIIRSESLMRARAVGEGNLVILFGAKTGRDGIHGATFASDKLDEESEAKRPNVQVGDPFAEKMLIECSLKMLDEDLLVSLQDLGAAGITSSASEMAAKGEVGIEIDASLIPLREEGMKPWEIVISESQERMLAVVEPEKAGEVLKLAERYELEAAVVGRVAGHGDLRILEKGEIVGTVPAGHLADAPTYEREVVRPSYLSDIRPIDLDLTTLPPPKDYSAALLAMLAHPNLCSRRSVYTQYDHQVGSDTVVLPGADAAVMRIKGTSLGFAATADCRGRHCYLDPKGGAASSVAEAYRNLSCVGAEPVALTDCLNFGSPEKTDAYYQLVSCIEGLAGACEVLKTPVVSGNVSLYNETEGGAVYPTPTVGMVGVFEDVNRRATPAIKREGDALVLVGKFRPSLSGSEYLEIVHGQINDAPAAPDLDGEKAAADVVRQAIAAGVVDTAHDLSGGGLAVTLAEMMMAGGVGAEARLLPGGRQDVALFGEVGGCILVAVPEERLGELEEHLREVHHVRIGETGGERLKVSGIDVGIGELRGAYERDLFERHAPEGGQLG